jgi:hypothetical protein
VPPDFQVVRIKGEIMPVADYLKQLERENGCTQPHVTAWARRGEHREHAWNWVWWRRIDYFYTLFVTCLLILLPLFWEPEGNVCESRFCFASGAIDLLKVFLPAFAENLINTYTRAPGLFLLLVLAVATGILLGRLLERRVSDTTRPLWYGIPCLKPSSLQEAPEPVTPGRINRIVERLRTSAPYQGFFRCLRRWILAIFFAVLFLVAGLMLVFRLSFTVGSSLGYVCSTSSGQRKVSGRVEMTGTFHTSDPCAATGLYLEADKTYRVIFTLPTDEPWLDATLPANPLGAELPPWSEAFVPIRRHIALPWYQPVARMGSFGSDYYTLKFKPLPQGQQTGTDSETYAADLTARQSDELFLYVNDAVVAPGLPNWFYNNNSGSAHVFVEQHPSD